MERQTDKKNGIRLQSLNRIMISITVMLAVAFVLVTFSTNRSFVRLEEATEVYIRARGDASSMQAGSDYLTDRVRTFIVTGDIGSAEDYFREVEATRRRELAVNSMEEYLSGTDTARYLSAALQASNHLAEIECYAMGLAAAGNGLDLQALPSTLQAVALKEEDASLPPQKQVDKAHELVFNETYQGYKEEIRKNLSLCEQALIRKTEEAQKQSSRQLRNALSTQTVLIVVVVLVVIAIVLYTNRLVIEPIHTIENAIREDRQAEEQGAYELRFVTRAYNNALSQSQQSREALAYKATHDALTGLFNRGTFDKAKQSVRGRAQAMLILDVDHFKEFNDTYGHEMGDRVLQKVANTLMNNFRSEDYVCRFGGDEFTVIMVHTTSALRSLVEDKLSSIRAALRDTSDGLPPITLSIGVAFSDRPEPTDDILKDADTALYVTKERGKDGVTFYGD